MEERQGIGAWLACIAMLVLAVVFGILWFFRGGDISRLNAELENGQDALRRTETELRTARSAIDAANRRESDLENRLRDETRRAADALQNTERRMRTEIDALNQQRATGETELERLRAQHNDTKESSDTIINDLQAALEQAKSQTEEVRAAGETQISTLVNKVSEAQERIAELEERIALSESRAADEDEPSISQPEQDARLAEKEAEFAARLAVLQQEAAERRDQAKAAEKARAETAAKLELLEAAFVRQSGSLRVEDAEGHDRAETETDFIRQIDSLRLEAAENRDRADAAERAEAETASRLELLEVEFARQGESLQQASDCIVMLQGKLSQCK